jgi:uncharacterized protein YyaL (SSP411 family)
MHFHFSPRREVALVGEAVEPLARVLRTRFLPAIVVAGMRPGDAEAEAEIPLLRERSAVNGKPAAYVCENFACKMPVSEPEDLRRELDG